MTAPPAQVFISYRRDDSAGYARALHDQLAQQLGAERVFIDVDDIHAGQAFDQRIAQEVGSARVLLVLIGPRWLAPHDGGLPRLHSADDFVHQELAAGLAGGLQVIPLLLDGAAMPGAAQLPAPLRALARRQALVIDARRFAADTAQLVDLLRTALGTPPPPPVPPPVPPPAPAAPTRRWPAAALAAVALLAAGLWWLQRPAPGPQPTSQQVGGPSSAPNTAPTPAARPAINGRWQAQVRYDWPGADHTEQLQLSGEGTALSGTVSFLRVPRGIEGGQVDADGIRFSTRSSEQLGAAERTVTHRYHGKLVGDALQLVMQTEGAAQPHRPVEITARRVAAP